MKRSPLMPSIATGTSRPSSTMPSVSRRRVLVVRELEGGGGAGEIGCGGSHPDLELKPSSFMVVASEAQAQTALARLSAGRIGWAVTALTDELGRFATYKIVDPSFHNWMALAMRNQEISDFPVCNKSVNGSYSGHDL